MDGRRYLHFDDYASWKGRAVRGKLERQPGILAASWNTWRERQGPTARLADAPVGPLTCWAADAPYSVHDTDEARKQAQERADLLAGLRRWTVHDFDREQGYFTRPSPLRKRSFKQAAADWRDQALLFAQEVFALREVLGRVAERYFEGNRLLCNEAHKPLDTQASVWRMLLNRFNDLVVAEFQRGPDEAAAVERLSLADTEEAGQALVPDRAAYLVDLAKADALRTLGEPNAAAVMERHVG